MQVCMSEEKINKLEISMTQLGGSLNLITEVVRRIEEKFDTHVAEEKNFMTTADEKFASKESVKKTEDDVKNIKEKMEQRSYDWVRYILMALFGFLLNYLIK